MQLVVSSKPRSMGALVRGKDEQSVYQQQVVTLVCWAMACEDSGAGRGCRTRVVVRDVAELAGEESAQRGRLGGGQQALDQLQVHRRRVVLSFLSRARNG